MFITHSYLGTTKGPYRCLFFLLLEDYIEVQTQFVKELELYLERFARRLGDLSAVVKPFAADIEDTRKHVLDKQWSEKELREISKTPSLLMINEDFGTFDPRLHPWLQFHFGQKLYEGVPGVYRYGDTLQRLAEAVLDVNHDVFEAAHDLVHKLEFSDALRVFEVKPGVFGVSINLIKGTEVITTLCRRLTGSRRREQ